jgi:DNA-binding CsgD family transcriptional regulator
MLHIAEHYGAAIAIGDGRLEAADAMARRSEEWGRLLTGRDASGSFGVQMFSLRREQDRLAELAPVIRVLAHAPRDHGPWRPGLASLLAGLGMEDQARRELTRVRAEGLEAFRASLWLAALVYLTDACARVGDEAMAALLYPELEPLAGRNIMIGHLVAWYGAADRYLGLLAATLGDGDRAEAHFEAALDFDRRMGGTTWVAHTSVDLAALLLRRGRADRERAERLLGEAAALAERHGLPAVARRVASLGVRPRAPALPDGLSPREAQILRLVAQGLSNREIGAALVISEHTAANHIRSILRKTGCANRTEAASYAHRQRLVEA